MVKCGPDTCGTIRNTEAPHKDESKKRKYAQLYALENMESENLQENFGISTRVSTPAFESGDLEMAFSPKHRLKELLKHCNTKNILKIFGCIDPNGGGFNRMAISIGYFNMITGEIVVSCFLLPRIFINGFKFRAHYIIITYLHHKRMD